MSNIQEKQEQKPGFSGGRSSTCPRMADQSAQSTTRSGSVRGSRECRQLCGIAETKPNLAIIDISLNAASGLDLVKDLCIRHPLVASLVLSMHEEDLYAERAMRAGARGT